MKRYQTAGTRSSENRLTLDEDEARELRIVKQAIIKSAIEGKVILKGWKGRKTGTFIPLTEKEVKKHPEEEYPLIEETDEEFVERWLRYIYRNTAEDKKLTETPKPVLKDSQGNDIPF